MKALILVGGFGTRLRPLTLTVPKPLVPFINKPIVIHQVEALKEAGVTEVVLAVAYRPEAMKAEMEAWAKELGVRFVFSHEKEPLGTAGPIALAREVLSDGSGEPFFVLNSDVTCKFPMKELLAFHKQHGHEGTIMVTKVQQWDKYGVVVYDQGTGQIDQFVEKPKQFVGDKINSGIYIFNQSVLNRIPLEKTSIETQIFPQMASAGELYALELEGYWMDIGQPLDYIAGLSRALPALAGSRRAEVLITDEQAAAKGISVNGCVVVHPSAVIEPGCELGPNVTIGANCKVGPCVRISNSAIFEGTKIQHGAYINDSIVGWRNTVGAWSRVENATVTGDDVHIKPQLHINGAKVLPNKDIKVSVTEPQVIM